MNQIKSIEIKNIKGISYKKYDLDIIPNKPSILVAPNGFGKSSLAIGFKSMNRNGIVLDKGNYHRGDSRNLPCIKIEYQKDNLCPLVANDKSNTISTEFDWFVINCLTKPKGIGSQYGVATARLEIEDVVLYDKIPTKEKFKYSITDLKNKFGTNGKILPNIQDSVLTDRIFFEWMMDQRFRDLRSASEQNKIQNKIQDIILKINQQQGTETQLLGWIESNVLDDLKHIKYLRNIVNKMTNTKSFNETQKYLAAIEIIWMFANNKQNFKNACAYNNYLKNKEQFDKLITDMNSTWKEIRTKEKGKGKQLVVQFPRATDLSNGQRDILSFISMLFRAKQQLKKNANILIIDEIFDYLDDANLISAQYYITKFIDDFKEEGREIYPLILTHLDPDYFNNYVFSNQKIYYLDKAKSKVNPDFVKLLKTRNNETIKDDVAKYLFHYHPDQINKENEFKLLNLKESWGKGNDFYDYINQEGEKYLKEGENYDPFAVCSALRVKIEKIAYEQLQSEENKSVFLDTHTTKEKLDKAKEFGVDVPESHYLLGLIYNDGMHWKENQDKTSAISSKLKNLTIKNMIQDVFSEK
jgi:hypothetical protein